MSVRNLETPEQAARADKTVPFRTHDPAGLRQWKERVQETPGALGAAAGVHADIPADAGLPPLAVADQSEGASNDDNAAVRGFLAFPPDSNLGVGPDHVFEMVNSVGRIADKLGRPVQIVSLAAFFDVDSGFDEFDPRVTYDGASGRWFAVYAEANDITKVASLLLAVSTTSDPTGAFCRYRLGNPTTEAFEQDFPMLGVGTNTVIVSYNGFGFGAEGTFVGAGYYVLNKADLVACAGVRRTRVAPDPAHFTLFPATPLGSANVLFMVENQGELLTGLAVSGVPGVTAVTATAGAIPIRPWNPPPNARQPGSSARLDTGDERVLGAVWQNDSLWVTGDEACIPPGDVAVRSCLRLIEIRTDTGDLHQDATHGAAGHDSYYPAISPDGSGNLHMVFTSSSTTEFASLRVAGRLATDPPGSLQPSRILRAGTGAQIDPLGRMGDYSGAAIDPSDPSSVWVVGEYIRSTALRDWGTFVARLSFATPAIGAPGVAVTLSGTAFRPGQPLTIGISAQNPGDAPPLDLYVGAIRPDGTIVFFSAPDSTGVYAPGQPLSAIVPMQVLPPGVSLSVPALVQFTVPPGLAAGTYQFFAALLHQGALADDSVDPGDLIVSDARSFTIGP